MLIDRGRRVAVGLIVAAVLLGCTMPAYLAWRSGDPIAYPTWVAQTLEVLTQQAVTPSPSPTLEPAPTFILPTLAPPVTLTVGTRTGCYAGPGDNYGLVIMVEPEVVYPVVGRDTTQQHWAIDVPGYAGTTCWIADEAVQLSGDGSTVPVPLMPPPSLYTLSEPRNLQLSCRPGGGNVWNVTMRWTNTEPNATGVRIYRNSRVIDVVGPGVRSYLASFAHRPNQGEVSFGVQAFNNQYMSSIVKADIRRCE